MRSPWSGIGGSPAAFCQVRSSEMEGWAVIEEYACLPALFLCAGSNGWVQKVYMYRSGREVSLEQSVHKVRLMPLVPD